MTKKERQDIAFKLLRQLKKGVERIKQLEAKGLNGSEHTAMREQINASCAVISLCCNTKPFHASDFEGYVEITQDLRKNHGWFGWL